MLLGAQTLGASVLYWYSVPLYRTVLADPAAHEPDLRNLLWALPSIALMPLGYWLSFWIRPALPPFVQPVLGHVVLCLARLTFIIASAAFGLVFVAPRPGFSIPTDRYVVTLLGVFSVFCYTLELERFGRSLLGRAPTT